MVCIVKENDPTSRKNHYKIKRKAPNLDIYFITTNVIFKQSILIWLTNVQTHPVQIWAQKHDQCSSGLSIPLFPTRF